MRETSLQYFRPNRHIDPQIEIVGINSGGIVLYQTSENKSADQLCSNCTADLCLCFFVYAKIWFSLDAAKLFAGHVLQCMLDSRLKG